MAKASTLGYSSYRPRINSFEAAIDHIPLSQCAEFTCSPDEVRRRRAFLYGINRDGIRRFRTVYEGDTFYVWRIK